MIPVLKKHIPGHPNIVMQYMTAEEFEKQLRELPREAELIELFKKLSGPGPLPKR